MSEETPTFKVTDRRLFNPDGTARPVDPDAAPKPAASATPVVAPSTTSDDAAMSSVVSDAAPSTAATSSNASSSTSSPPATETAAQPGAHGDPNAFINLIMFIASPAAAALGLTEHPGMAGREVDLPLAKHCIDLLATLREKTIGKLVPEETETLDGLLSELRMQFVSLSQAYTRNPATPPRGGFSGNDITGGK